MPHDFAYLFCERFRVEPPGYCTEVLRRILYPQARVLRPFLRVLNPDYFGADLHFVESVGRITKRRDFTAEAGEFTHHPENRVFLRRALRMRASVGRMQALVDEVFGGTTGHPFPRPGPPASLSQ